MLQFQRQLWLRLPLTGQRLCLRQCVGSPSKVLRRWAFPGDGRLPYDKDPSTVDKLSLRFIQSWSLGRSQYWKSVKDQSETDSYCPRRERNLLLLPPLSIAEALAWHQCEGNVDLLADYANFTNEGINHLNGSPGKRLRKNPSLSQQAVQHNISDKVERLYARLNEGNVTFDQKAALKLAQMDADDDSPPPAARLIASAFDIKKTAAQSTLCDVFQKSTRRHCERSPQICPFGGCRVSASATPTSAHTRCLVGFGMPAWSAASIDEEGW